jgi:Helix-turn-helix domain
MRIRKNAKVMPPGGSQTLPSVGKSESRDQARFVWEELAPRLLHPSKLAFIQALLKSGQPLTLGELADAAGITKEHAKHQCKSMQRAGVLVVRSVAPRSEGEEEEPSYFFPEPTESHAS